MPTSMTVLIHGTWSHAGVLDPIESTLGESVFFWYLPNSEFQRYVRREQIFADVYDKDDYFHWSAAADHDERMMAAEQLVAWCRERPVDQLRLVGHSHGATVASIATHSMQVHELVLLSPPVPPEGHAWQAAYRPLLQNVSPGCFFTVFAERDGVIGSVGDNTWRKNYKGTELGDNECRKMLRRRSWHWSSVSIRRWRDNKIPEMLAGGCDLPDEPVEV